MNPLDTLRAEIRASIDRYEHEIGVRRAQVETLNNVLCAIDELAEAEPAPAASESPDGAPRAPRRDIKGTVLKVVADRSSATGVCVELPDICKGAGILLDAPLTESAAQRAVDALVRDGDLLRRGDGYIPNQPYTAPLAHAAK